MVNINILF